MKVICIINLKGGVAKTVSAINIAHILNKKYKKRVLLIDCDKQGNTSKFFKFHSYENLSIADILTSKEHKDPYTRQESLKGVLKYLNDSFAVLPANMNLLRADKEILLDVSKPQQTRLRKALYEIDELVYAYDYAIIDCAPGLDMTTINALVAADDILIPIRVDNFALDGVEQLLEQIEELREFNPTINVAGGFITMYTKNNVNMQGVEVLNEKAGLPMFGTVIRKTVKVDETTFTGIPLAEYAPKSTAARDYEALVDEYLQYVTENSTNGGSGDNG